jgi:hypothetical protein
VVQNRGGNSESRQGVVGQCMSKKEQPVQNQQKKIPQNITTARLSTSIVMCLSFKRTGMNTKKPQSIQHNSREGPYGEKGS